MLQPQKWTEGGSKRQHLFEESTTSETVRRLSSYERSIHSHSADQEITHQHLHRHSCAEVSRRELFDAENEDPFACTTDDLIGVIHGEDTDLGEWQPDTLGQIEAHASRAPLRTLEQPSPSDTPTMASPLKVQPQSRISVYDYSSTVFSCSFFESDQIGEFLARNRPAGNRWICVDGHDSSAVETLAQHFHLHELAVEDVFDLSARPKADSYSTFVFVIARVLLLDSKPAEFSNVSRLFLQQVSFFLMENVLITIRDGKASRALGDVDDVWEGVFERLERASTKMRGADVCFLMYCLLDAMVDAVFPIAEFYGGQLEDLELHLTEMSTSVLVEDVHAIRKDLLVLRRTLWPLRETIASLQRGEHLFIDPETCVYLNDVYDHCVQLIEMIETYRELGQGLRDSCLSIMSHRMNEVMKVLTIISTIFIPLSFFAGVYGMNFPAQDMAEMVNPLGYPYFFWGLCLGVMFFLLFFFYKKRWMSVI